MKPFLRLIFCAVILALLFSGCARKFKMPKDSLGRESKWQFHRSDIHGTGAIEGTFNGTLNIIWEEDTGTRPSGPLTLGKGYLIYPGGRKKVKIYDAADGAYSGYVKTKGHTPAGMIISDSLAFYVDGTRKNVLRCLNLLTRKTVWSVPITDAVSGLIITNDKLILGLTSGSILAFNTGTGGKEWSFNSKERLLAPPSVGRNLIVQPGDKGTLFLLNSENGNEIARMEMNEPFLAAAAVDSLIYLTDMPGNVYALESDSGSIIWKSPVTGPIWSAPAVGKGIVCVTSNSGEVNAFDFKTGQMLWKYDANEVIKSSPIIVGDFILFGTMTGKLFSLKAADGTVISKRDFKGAISQSPISNGESIFVATDVGEIVCLGKSKQTHSSNK